jgi:hypothetical protein
MSPIYTDETPNEHMMLFDDLYVNYVKFCKKNGVAESVMATNQKFGRDMGVLGYRKRNDIGKENHTGYLVYAAQEIKINGDAHRSSRSAKSFYLLAVSKKIGV